MSRVTEMAKAEADAAEAEESTDPAAAGEDENEVAEAEEQDAPPPVDTGAIDPKVFEKEQARHEAAVAEMFGPMFAGMSACETCGGVGFTPDDLEPLPPLLPDPTLVRCTDCNGYGQRETPSLADNYLHTPCTACTGTGYRDRAALEAQRQADAYRAPEVPPGPPPPPVWNQSLGQWEDHTGRVLA